MRLHPSMARRVSNTMVDCIASCACEALRSLIICVSFKTETGNRCVFTQLEPSDNELSSALFMMGRLKSLVVSAVFLEVYIP